MKKVMIKAGDDTEWYEATPAKPQDMIHGVFHECGYCGRSITEVEHESLRFDMPCPRCRMRLISEYERKEYGDA